MQDKKSLITAIAMGTLLATGVAQAEDTLYFAGYGGSSEDLFRDRILPAFEEANGIKVQYVAGNSAATVAKLQAQRNKPEIDVAMIDEGPVFQAISMGLCQPVAEETFDQVVPLARLNQDKAIGLGIIATGIAYNTEYFAEQGWDEPNSWDDLADPRYNQRLSVPPISNGYGIITLVMEARINGGSEKDIDPGFDAFKERIGPNVLTYEPSSGKMSELFQSGEIVMSTWGSGRVKSLADTGFPVKFAYPKEGAASLMTTVCPVTGSDMPEMSQKLIAYLVSDEVQAILAAEKAWGPTNKNIELDPQLASTLPYGESLKSLTPIDWDTVNENRADWTKRWTREVE
ncbi:ABC transporter substrate-binding protein [Marinobacterium lutimaris]|uniref:Putative spermidine/putrescine transport system substrate-binding protein n=1 Tax=Marinobacterium lutimaris TaxID=568106 RepID=A0A1H5TQV6_9GAMM|nr:ABC transporter substrate-binding protein [Marinobacterium lutimaris]SEF65185.1 putative spermidine/putrescine transport system substrate-binding protein [Marinobacterium lutimaris]